MDRSAEALPWLIPPEEADKRTTHTRQEAQELEERMTCLLLLFEDVADDRILAKEELGAAADEFQLRLTMRQRALTRELREEKLQKARQLQDQGDMSGARECEGLACIIDFDVKQGVKGKCALGPFLSILTGLWVKNRQGHCKQFNKGIVRIPGTTNQVFDKYEPERVSLATRLNTVDVTYDVVE
ncbi:hypothetical protein ACJX0J_010283, partial [Zea mays]